jgi:hypothetical protein
MKRKLRVEQMLNLLMADELRDNETSVKEVKALQAILSVYSN